ncbi:MULTISPECIES: polyprenyl synthetase family protein [unclassified Halanaerobium]|uniref:polyprenyl synthetase family protein n=1 Tax=unclassified Halanaerobium TaxID=2641197 RepID=UPI000DF33659|nr:MULTISPECIES: polyprenyl synthetase family protein [unclassified Halanaerobium]RCW40336.1 heptaprenyl diphosphate synthase [Halanaerobium sp. MA284_MarDTE_T2]RCW87996.1 heptaprenyl diphosphate synthase [Halanaerobium sp. DL-01]
MEIKDEYYKKIVKKINDKIYSATSTHHPIISEAVDDLVKGGGKRLRPVMMFISASFGDYDREKLLELGAGLELLHMASLIHDDIIDDADIRRGNKTAQSKFGKNTSVLIGDFLLSRTFSIFSAHLDNKMLQKLNKIVRLICEGEIEQAEKKFDFNINTRDYLKIIRHKTALFFGFATHLGAYVSDIRGIRLNTLYKLGLEIGMAFQIQDDILDFTGKESKTGKALGRDLKEGVVTLPVICLLENNNYRKKYDKLINGGRIREKELDLLIKDVKESDSIEKSKELLKKFIYRVEKHLDNLPDNRAKKRMKKIVDFQIDRNY